MNEHLPPLTPDQVDELLSAELDGEFDAAATDLGLDPERAAALLDATDGVTARRHALERAHDAIADVPPLDELTETRLRTTALAAASESGDELSRARRRRAWMSAAAVAAALVAVLGIAAVANRNSSDSKGVNSAGAALGDSPARIAAAPTTATGTILAPTDFGTVADAAALSDRVAATLHSSSAKVATHGKVPATSNLNAGRADDSYAAYEMTPSAYPACGTSAGKAVEAGSPLVLSGTATLARKPVTVYVYRNGTEYVLVASDQGCKIVARRVLRR